MVPLLGLAAELTVVLMTTAIANRIVTARIVLVRTDKEKTACIEVEKARIKTVCCFCINIFFVS